MIKPTIGRVVLVYRHPRVQPEPEPAFVCFVHTDRCINVGGFDANGAPFGATSVPLLQDDDVPPSGQTYAEWMPFQKGQAAKYEQLAAETGRAPT